jgi:hypothetical protein
LSLFAFVQNAGSQVAGKRWRQFSNRCQRSLANSLCPRGIINPEGIKTRSQPFSVELIDGEHSDAALCTSGTADKPFTAA